MKPITEQERTLFSRLGNGFIFIIKSLIVILCLFAGILMVSQSSVSPVSTRLLTRYALEYADHKIKPYRIYFPRPYIVNLTEEKR